MVQSKKFRGVRQRQWGSWVSEIRHPLLKKRIWLGTFDTAEAAARAYDEAAVLMSGRNAKTNFPVPVQEIQEMENKVNDHISSESTLSDALGAKLRKSTLLKAPPTSSITCLRLDNDSSNLGLWRKAAGKPSASDWVLKLELVGKKTTTTPSPSSSSLSSGITDFHEFGDEENRVAMQMVEELLHSPSLLANDFELLIS